MLDQSRANRIAEHIAERREEMAVLLNRKTLESALPDVTMAPVMLVAPPDVARHPPLHEGAQRSFGGRLHNKMKMIRHEADAKHLDREFGFCRGEQVEEGRVVTVFMEGDRPTVLPIQKMVEDGKRARLFVRVEPEAWSRKVRKAGVARQEYVAYRLFLSPMVTR